MSKKKKKCGWVRRKRLLGRNGPEIPATLYVSWYFSIFGNDTLESWNLVFSLFLIKTHFNYLSVFSTTTLFYQHTEFCHNSDTGISISAPRVLYKPVSSWSWRIQPRHGLHQEALQKHTTFQTGWDFHLYSLWYYGI